MSGLSNLRALCLLAALAFAASACGDDGTFLRRDAGPLVDAIEANGITADQGATNPNVAGEGNANDPVAGGGGSPAPGGWTPAPGGGDPTPGGGDPTPGGGDPTPGGGGTTPGGGDPTPGGGDPTPGGGDPEPGGGDPEPGGGDPEPGGGDPEPGGGDPTPGGGDPEPTTPTEVGAPCTSSGQCGDHPNAVCIPATFSDGTAGWPGGYCSVVTCEQVGCPAGSDCFQFDDETTLCLETCGAYTDCTGTGYACADPGACIPGCRPSDCTDGTTCLANGFCGVPPCTPGSCGNNMTCNDDGRCVPAGNMAPGPGPGPACLGLPAPTCSGGGCGSLGRFLPPEGIGYTDFPINGESWDNQYRSYAHGGLRALIEWATAFVDCKAETWPGQHRPLGLGDMSEANGAIPGTAIGQPGHPPNTHVNGNDIDIAYYQFGTPDNRLRSVCPHVSGGYDQHRCVAPPESLDVWRTALFLGALLSSGSVRVVGIDGQIAPLVIPAIQQLCADDWLPGNACQNLNRLGYETVNEGRGWYLHHHHHLHVSYSWPRSSGNALITPDHAWRPYKDWTREPAPGTVPYRLTSPFRAPPELLD